MVNDLTSNAFIECLKRIIARRRKPIKIFSDNGTNFVGARDELILLKAFLSAKEQQLNLAASKLGTEWSIIPPRAPHFGGLWEASVKRAKQLMKATINSNNLTFEEQNTLVIETEAILNSCPLTPLSNSPNDLKSLTPKNFLIQGNASGLNESEIKDVSTNPVRRWHLPPKLRKEF